MRNELHVESSVDVNVELAVAPGEISEQDTPQDAKPQYFCGGPD
jgi:hypothetical protein